EGAHHDPPARVGGRGAGRLPPPAQEERLAMEAPLSIPLADPKIQRLLALDSGKALGPLAGDVPDPTGLTSRHGHMWTTRLSAGKEEVIVLFGDQVMTVDVYAIPGEPIKVHLYCPRCHKLLTVAQDRKAIDYDRAA